MVVGSGGEHGRGRSGRDVYEFQGRHRGQDAGTRQRILGNQEAPWVGC